MNKTLYNFEVIILINKFSALEGFEALGFKQIRMIIGLHVN